jgi:hypothetical protein
MVAHRFARAAFAASAILATGCWPGIPVASGILANNQDDHRTVTPSVTLHGTIVTDPTASLPVPPIVHDEGPAAGGPAIELSASQVDLGATGTKFIVQASNSGDGTLTLATITATPVLGVDTSWLVLSVLADGKTIDLAVDRTALASGDYEASVDVSSNGGTANFIVGMNVGVSTPTPIGPVVVEILGEDATTLIARVTTTAAAGYAWAIPDLPRASYYFRAGVDLDSDGVLGEPGEPFGAYPASDLKPIDAGLLSEIQIDLLVVE